MAELTTSQQPPTPGQIIAYEERRGSQAWEGPQGNADAWYLATHFWNIESHQLMANISGASNALGGLG